MRTAAMALAAALIGTGCYVTAEPVPATRYFVIHGHVHGPDCGHYRVWNDDLWVYYYDGRWEYHNPTSHRWVYYSPGYEPVALHGHISLARSHRPYAPALSSVPPGAVKAEPLRFDTPTKAPDMVPSKAAPPDAVRSVPTKGTPKHRPTKRHRDK